jgi:secreted PhoX family phosphatase
MNITRRSFLKNTGWSAFCLFASYPFFGDKKTHLFNQREESDAGFGPLIEDSERIMDLPSGFSYKILSRAGEKMVDGFYAPARPDGMGTFRGPDGLTIILRNHEIFPEMSSLSGPFGYQNQLLRRLNRRAIYDRGRQDNPALGSVTALVYDTNSRELKQQFLTLAGTLVNCSGGVTPWNSWLSCEEIFQNTGLRFAKNHGYVFEIPASVEPKVTRPIPLKAMGRFVHESAAVDLRTNIIYQTEDQTDCLVYRFLPKRPGRLEEGGELQCLSIASKPRFDTRNWEEQQVKPGESLPVSWIELENVDSKKDDLRTRGYQKGAALFASGEGMVWSEGTVYFDCTNGGRIRAGQIWRYFPSPYEGTEKELESPGRLELLAEPNNRSVVEHPDQMTTTPWGDLFVCEDGYGEQFLVGVTPSGQIYKFARNAMDESEFAGVCFSPDRSTMFVNYMDAGLTFAVTGPWKSKSGK